jgi:lysozyme family protein
MRRWIAGVGAGGLLTVAGLIIILGNVEWVMRLAGAAAEMPSPQSGNAVWVGVAFARVFGAALVVIGLLTSAASRLDDAAARQVRVPLAVGLTLLMVLTGAQALAIWNTPAAWVLWAVVAVAWGSVFTWGLTRRVVHSAK